MRRMVLGTLLALPLALAVSASAGMEQQTTTTTTYSGTISDVSPSSSTIILKSEGSPQTMTKYVYNDRTVWVDPAGNTVTTETVRNQPVTVYYEKEGDQMVVTKVVTQKPLPSRIIEQKTTTTKTTDFPE